MDIDIELLKIQINLEYENARNIHSREFTEGMNFALKLVSTFFDALKLDKIE